MAAKKKAAQAPRAKTPLRNQAAELANVVRAMRAFVMALPPQESAVEAARQDVIAAADEMLAE